MAEYKKYKLTGKKEEGKGIYTFVFKPMEGKVPSYKPGQFFVLKNINMPSEIKHNFRSYSCLHPHNEEEISFGIKVHGEFTTALNKLKEEDVVDLSGPYGMFLLPEKIDTPIIFLGGGCGITPILCMVEYLHSVKHNKKYYLLYSARHANEFAYKKKLDEMAKKDDNFEIAYTITRGDAPAGWCEEIGRIDIGMIKVKCLVQKDACYYMCGPKMFVQCITGQLIGAGVGKENIHAEKW
ncbi:MAG: FAD-binding oxidoreductase [Candidatus Micrarchaeota archaeon]